MSFYQEEDLNDSYVEYQRSIRDRATDSIHELRQSLHNRPSISLSEKRRYRSRSPGSSQAWEQSRNIEHSDYTYGSAVGRLRTMMRQHEPKHQGPKTVQFSPRPGRVQNEDYNVYMSGSSPQRYPPVPRGEIPTPEETVPLLQNQAGQLTQVEAENKFCRDELQVLKMKLREVIEENRLLHEEIKRGVIQEIVQEGLEVPGIPKTLPGGEPLFPGSSPPDPHKPMSKQDYGKWHQELERIQVLHTAKVSRLEAQLTHTREELQQYEKEVDQLHSKVRMQESLRSVDPEVAGLAAGLCVRCGQNEAVLPPSLGATQKQSIDKLTKDRDELMDQLTQLKTQYERLKHHEESAYQQVKNSCQMVEQAQLEMTQAMVQREQLKEELVNMRRRMEEHVEEMTRKMQEERELARLESKSEREELNSKIKDLQESLVETQNSLEKTTRDKMTLLTDLEATKGNLNSFDLDYGKATDSMKMSMTQAVLERNTAVGHMQKLKKEFNNLEKDRDQEKSRLKTELENLRGRLNMAEKDLVETKEECIHLTNTVQSLERETHLAKLGKESIERTRNDDVKATRQRAEQREMELNMLLDNLETKHSQTSAELEDIVNSQASLVQRLRGECRKLTHQLEDNVARYRKDNRKLKANNEQLRLRLEKTVYRLSELEEQHTQQGALQEKMRDRLKQMDTHSAHSSSQVIELLAKESSMCRERQLLAREVEFLRQQLRSGDREHGEERLYSSHKVLVDDVLADVKQESLKRREELLSLPQERRKKEEWEMRMEYMDLVETQKTREVIVSEVRETAGSQRVSPRSPQVTPRSPEGGSTPRSGYQSGSEARSGSQED